MKRSTRPTRCGVLVAGGAGTGRGGGEAFVFPLPAPAGGRGAGLGFAGRALGAAVARRLDWTATTWSGCAAAGRDVCSLPNRSAISSIPAGPSWTRPHFGLGQVTRRPRRVQVVKVWPQ